MWITINALFLLILLPTFVLAQTACIDFESQPGHGPGANYTAWSLDHIQPWCRDHDPMSTAQCTPIVWPSYVDLPKRRKFHRHFKEWILKIEPHIGTRADCIARSFALSVNTQANSAGLVEAVTCDLYSFGKHRRRECVCYPVYDDHVVERYDGIMHTTTTTFYPPSQVVSSALLAAATQGPPEPCETGCPATAKVIEREPRSLNDFPYCSPARPAAAADLVRRTVVATRTKKKHGKQVTMTTTYPALPTTSPDCGNASYYTANTYSSCAIDLCIWNFVKSYTSTVSDWVTFTDAQGNAVRVDWNTTAFLVTTKHWGQYPPFSNPTSVSKTKVRDPWESAVSKSYAAYRTSIGLPTESLSEKQQKKQKKKEKKLEPVCRNETDCWDWCRAGVDKQTSQSYSMIGTAAVITAIALVGMLWTIRRRRMKRKAALPWARSGLDPAANQNTMQSVEIETESGPVLEVFALPREPERASTTGTLRRAAEEGRGRPRVRFTPDDQGVSGAAEGVRKVSGRQAKFEMTERGSIRSRVPSGGE